MQNSQGSDEEEQNLNLQSALLADRWTVTVIEGITYLDIEV